MKKIIILGSISIFIIIIVVINIPRFWTLYFIKSNFGKKDANWAYVVPVERTIKPLQIVSQNSLAFSTGTLNFQVPWSQLKLEKEMESYLFLTFSGSEDKGIYVSKNAITTSGIIETFIGNDTPESRKLKRLLENNELCFDYALYNEFLNTTPNQASILKPSKELIKIKVLLMLRSFFAGYDAGKIYKFETVTSKGFQFGDPQANQTIRLIIFDNNGKVIEMSIYSARQDEIDFILSTIKFL